MRWHGCGDERECPTYRHTEPVLLAVITSMIHAIFCACVALIGGSDPVLAIHQLLLGKILYLRGARLLPVTDHRGARSRGRKCRIYIHMVYM